MHHRKYIRSSLSAPGRTQVQSRMLDSCCGFILNMQRISSTGREWQLCSQRCYEVSLKIDPKENVVGVHPVYTCSFHGYF